MAPTVSSFLTFALLPALALCQDQKASFTVYGSGDQNGSNNCKSATPACGDGTQNVAGYTAAISQNEYGAGPGQGAGPACGKCYKLSLGSNQSGQSESSAPITVKVNNLCPAQGNEEWCQIGSNGTNSHGADVHFDLCLDTGAKSFLNGQGTGMGTAQEVDCSSGSSTGSSSGGSSSPSPSPAGGSSGGSSGGYSGGGTSAASSTQQSGIARMGSSPMKRPSPFPGMGSAGSIYKGSQAGNGGMLSGSTNSGSGNSNSNKGIQSGGTQSSSQNSNSGYGSSSQNSGTNSGSASGSLQSPGSSGSQGSQNSGGFGGFGGFGGMFGGSHKGSSYKYPPSGNLSGGKHHQKHNKEGSENKDNAGYYQALRA